MSAQNAWDVLPLIFNPLTAPKDAYDMGICGEMDIANEIWEKGGVYYLVNNGHADDPLNMTRYQVQKMITHCPGCNGKLPGHTDVC